MGLSIERIEILLLIAAVVAMLARRLRVPYSVGLVFAGIALALLPFSPNVILTKQLVFTVFLPPLIFDAAFQLRWPELRKDLPVIATLATLGVLLSAAAIAIGMHFLARWTWISAIVFGMLISATDPVSVIATFKDAKLHGRVRLLVEAESLFNDATAAVAFTLALLFASKALEERGSPRHLPLCSPDRSSAERLWPRSFCFLREPRTIIWSRSHLPLWQLLAPSCWPSIFISLAF